MRGYCGVTYTLGRSLYIAVTCRSNATTLPETRGPNFTLPIQVVLALQRLRMQEFNGNDQLSLQLHPPNDDLVMSNNIDGKVIVEKYLPPLPKVTTIPLEEAYDDDLLHQFQLDILQSLHEQPLKYVVFAGEGEPTLKLPILLSISRTIRENYHTMKLPIRIITNGLTISSLNDYVSGKCQNKLLKEMKDSGITHLSIALMTSCSEQYRELMNPTSYTSDRIHRNEAYCPHERLCQLIQAATAYGFHVELTGVDRPDIDKEKAEELAAKIGATFRWRPYYP